MKSDSFDTWVAREQQAVEAALSDWVPADTPAGLPDYDYFDVLANLGVIAAGALVAWTGSAVPDLVIGAAIGGLVLRGAVRILRL